MANPPNHHGRDRLIQAALSLSAQRRSFAAVGVREITREAGMSPGSFYRHFADLDALGVALIDNVEAILREALGRIWNELGGERDLATQSLKTYFALAQKHQDAFVVCARERHGASPVLRQSMLLLQQHLAEDLARGLIHRNLFQGVAPDVLEAAALDVVTHLNVCMLDYVDSDSRGRKAIRSQAERFVQYQFSGVLLEAGHALTVGPAAGRVA